MNTLGIVFSSRVRSLLLTLLGIWVVFQLATMSQEVVGAYRAGSGFDVTVSQFWIISLVFFIPYFLTAGYMLHALAARVAFYRLVKRQIVIAEYQPPAVLSAIEAGLMLDNAFGLPELAAELKKLELAGVIRIKDEPLELSLTLVQLESLEPQEALFVQALFAGNNTLVINGSTKARLLSAGAELAAETRSQLVAAGEIASTVRTTKVLRILFNIFLAMAIFVEAIDTFALITDPHGTLTVGYPRYPMNISEPLFMVGLIALVLLLVASGFYQRTLAGGQGLKNWRYVAGLRVYIEVVYKGKFFRDGVQTTTTAELQQFYPYAIALGVETGLTRRLERALIAL